MNTQQTNRSTSSTGKTPRRLVMALLGLLVSTLLSGLGVLATPGAAHAAGYVPNPDNDPNAVCNADKTYCTSTTTTDSIQACSNPTGTGTCVETTTTTQTCTYTVAPTTLVNAPTLYNESCASHPSVVRDVADTSVAQHLTFNTTDNMLVMVTDSYGLGLNGTPVVEERLVGASAWKSVPVAAGAAANAWSVDGLGGAACFRATAPASTVQTTTGGGDYTTHYKITYASATSSVLCRQHAATIDAHWQGARVNARLSAVLATSASVYDVQVSKKRSSGFHHFKSVKGHVKQTATGPNASFVAHLKKPAHGRRYYRIVIPQATGVSKSLTGVVVVGPKGPVGKSKSGLFSSHVMD